MGYIYRFCSIVMNNDFQEGLALSKRVADIPGRPWRSIHSYGFNGNSGPQAMTIHHEDLLFALFLMDETQAQAIRDSLYTNQVVNECVTAIHYLSQLGLMIYDVNAHHQAMNQVKDRYYEMLNKLEYAIRRLNNLEYMYQRSIVHNPRAIADQQLEPPLPTLDPLPHNLPPVLPINMDTMDRLMEIRNQIMNDPNNLFGLNWRQMMINDFGVLNHSIPVVEGVYEVDIDYGNHGDHNQFDVVVTNEGPNRIRLQSIRFSYANLPPNNLNVPYYLIGEEGAPGLLVYRNDTDSPGDLIPVYSHGIHGAHPVIGCNGWQAMTLQFHDVDNNQPRLWFVTRAMGAQLCQWFEEWDVMAVYREWFIALARFAAYLFEMQRFANYLEGDIQQQIRNQLAEHRNWLNETRNQLFSKYSLLSVLEKLYRHSVLVPDRPQGGHNDLLTCLDAWPQDIQLYP